MNISLGEGGSGEKLWSETSAEGESSTSRWNK